MLTGAAHGPRRPPHPGRAARGGPQGMGLARGGLLRGAGAVPRGRQLRPPRAKGLRGGLPAVPDDRPRPSGGDVHGGAPLQREHGALTFTSAITIIYNTYNMI